MSDRLRPACLSGVSALLRILTASTVAAVFAGTLAASGEDRYEVWAIDQSNTPGLSYGGTIYIWEGHDLENLQRARAPIAARIDLGADAAALCFARTGANPCVRT